MPPLICRLFGHLFIGPWRSVNGQWRRTCIVCGIGLRVVSAKRPRWNVRRVR